MRSLVALLPLLFCVRSGIVAAEYNCFPKRYNSDSLVCVCNDTNCGLLGKIQAETGQVVVYQSSIAGQRFERSIVEFGHSFMAKSSENTTADLIIRVNTNRTLQQIIGFGGAFTDAAGINWMSLNSQFLRDRLIECYYGPHGLEYNMGRIPMAGCDFSTRDYTYADLPNDFELNNFSLAIEDTDYKIPMIAAANKIATEQVYYLGSPWSAPGWMKTSGRTYGAGGIKGSPGGSYYKTWAEYFVKFYEAYKSHGVNIWGFTVQNEPTTGFMPWGWQTMAMSPYTERDFLKMDLGPALFNATNNNIKILVLDDNRIVLPWWANVIFRDPEASKYAAGLGVHWYLDGFRSANVLDEIRKTHSDKFIINTEACEGFQLLANAVMLGRWERAESYAMSILDDLRHSVSGWIDWNLYLDLTGGPNWVKNFVDAPIIVDRDKQAFYKQPMYYALAHFTKFIPRGSYRLDDELKTNVRTLSGVALLRPDELKVAVFLNTGSSNNTVEVNDADGRQFSFKIGPRSIATVIW
ncbi:putative glucosylceramidase 3 [Varroa destructor]|uniref:Glucosylceramidase n=1 Tax=Varroa destructor TaxID=109461 RepID=A0A7M7L3I7_VARDE|nr:putative glucosylceramidase 3 [Varroa destructor]XP_022673325.1 putative glucosylceramidase 3 [Varroa destructor]